jgi:two-component system, NarL family, nitrate/nitrite response regulator NarL
VPNPDLSILTPRERQIVDAICRGESTRQIARSHGLELKTVKNYLTTIYEKLGVTGRSDLQSPGAARSSSPSRELAT